MKGSSFFLKKETRQVVAKQPSHQGSSSICSSAFLLASSVSKSHPKIFTHQTKSTPIWKNHPKIFTLVQWCHGGEQEWEKGKGRREKMSWVSTKSSVGHQTHAWVYRVMARDGSLKPAHKSNLPKCRRSQSPRPLIVDFNPVKSLFLSLSLSHSICVRFVCLWRFEIF